MDPTQLDNASFFPTATVKAAVKNYTVHRERQVRRKWMISSDFCSCPRLGGRYPRPPPVWFSAGEVLHGDLSGRIFAGPPHDPFRSFHATSSQLLQVCLIFTYNIPLPSWVALLCFGFRTGAFFFPFLISLSFLFFCQFALEEGMSHFWSHQCLV